MTCKIDGCSRDAKYKEKKVCQMHYFRFMRNGSYDLRKTRKHRISNPAGYQKLYEPKHPLVNSDGYVYEHRFVYFNEVDCAPDSCKICGTNISWSDCHIDHIDEDVANNDKGNLRALCRSCNVFRGHTEKSMGKVFLTIGGKTMTPSSWARMPGVKVACNTIMRRKKHGMSDYDAVFSRKITHINTLPIVKRCKHDKVRGIV